jgi:hypothetical protein
MHLRFFFLGSNKFHNQISIILFGAANQVRQDPQAALPV